MLTQSFLDFVIQQLSVLFDAEVRFKQFLNLTGGSINNAVCLKTTSGDFFLKYNAADRFPGMFECERKGLEFLKTKNVIGIPVVITSGTFENNSFLLQEMILPGKRAKNYSENLGSRLAQLHRFTSSTFGLDHNNYIGSLGQLNRNTISGCDFMIQYRLEPLTKRARQNQLLATHEVTLLEKLYPVLAGLLPEEIPSLLHGDLWSGNVITGSDGQAVLIDPAIYYGYRETDLAMMRLFGGFDEEVYHSYNEAFPLYPGWETRIGVFQLYPLLVHLNLFGRGYWSSINQILKNILVNN